MAQSKIPDGLLPDSAFNRMILRDISYAILGEYTPATGLKADISKPEMTISGLFTKNEYNSWKFGFNLKAAANVGYARFFGGSGRANNAFELALPFHFIPECSSAKWYTNTGAVAKVRNRIIEEEFIKKEDEFFALKLLYDWHFDSLPTMKDETVQQLAGLNDINSKRRKAVDVAIKKYFNVETGGKSLCEALKLVTKVKIDTTGKETEIKDGVYNDILVRDFESLKKDYLKLADAKYDKMIENVSKIWSEKNYFWVTGIPRIGTQKVQFRQTKFEGRDSNYIKSDYPLEWGGTVFFNFYKDWPQHAWTLFFRLGFTGLSTNNLSNLSPYDYERIRPLYSYPNDTTIRIARGSAYNQFDFKTGALFEIPFEAYLLSKEYWPGVYISTSFRHSKLFNLPDVVDRKSKNKQIPLEAGVIFNVKSREKERNFVSISLYWRSNDLTDKPRVYIDQRPPETRADFLDRNISFGVRVGLPIFLSKKEE